MAYWVTFTNRTPGSIETAKGEDPRTVAAAFGEVRTIDPIPYPSSPKLNDQTGCPPFCYAPAKECKGLSSCPQSRACSE